MSLIENTTNSFGTIPVVVGNSKVEQRFPATEAQLEVWLSSGQSIEASCAYNEISSLVIQGDLDVSVLKSAIEKVVERHALLRATFSEDGQTAIINSEPDFGFEFLDWSKADAADLEVKKIEVIQKQACTPFDLVDGPLLRVVVQQFADNEFRLTFTAHHIVLDGWSLAVFVNDLGHWYDALRNNTNAELPAVNSYDGYSNKMEEYFASEKGQADEAYWVSQFADSIPVLDLPIENSRPSLRTYFGRRYDHQFSTAQIEGLRKVGAKAGCSLFNTMLAAFQAYVARLSGTEDFCVGIPTAGQAAMDQLELIGHCVNTLPLRTQVDVSLGFTDYMKQSRGELLDAMDHQRYSFGQLLRKLAPPRDPSRPPMLSISFNLDPAINTSELGFTGLKVDVLVEPRMFENFEWFINGVINEDKSVEMQVQYNADLYSSQSMSFYFEGFEAFLTALIAKPETRIEDLPLMSVAQRQMVLEEWNRSPIDYPETATLHEELSRQAQASPDKVAVQFGDQKVTYSQLDRQSNQIARYLQSQQIGAGDLAGICVERSERMLVYLLGILKSGAGYVPLDPAYPSDRLQYMCDHSQMKLIVTESEIAERVKAFNKPIIELDSVANEIASLSSDAVTSEATPSGTCYVIYTSGSTGKPKGVVVPHGPVVNFLYSMKDTPGFGENDSILAVTTLSFDIAVLELYLPTITGGTVYISDSETATDGIKLAKAVEDLNISLLQATPATWRMLIQSGWNGKPDLKVLCGGEPMPTDLVGPLLDRCGQLWNMYGPTETTVWSAVYQITESDAPIMIGRPIGNTQIYLLDKNGNEVPPGAEGEVFIGGAGVTHGYIHRPDLTQERFIENRYFNPFKNYVNYRLYKTGDLARYRFNGNLQFLRRNDKQVKVRGFRIELGEIEQTLETHPTLAQNVVIVREDTTGDARLVAYFVPKSGQSVNTNDLRDHLRESLPYYMVPQHFVELDQMPQTNNGKIDYKALPVPAKQSVPVATTESAEPSSESEKYLANVWKDVLEVDDIDLNDNFFEIGGHSLLVMKVITNVKEKTGVKLGPQDFLVGTLEQLADKISDAPCFGNSAEEVELDSVNSNTTTANSQVIEPSNESFSAKESAEKQIEESSESESFLKNVLKKKLKGFWD